jgi:cytochrome P450
VTDPTPEDPPSDVRNWTGIAASAELRDYFEQIVDERRAKRVPQLRSDHLAAVQAKLAATGEYHDMALFERLLNTAH